MQNLYQSCSQRYARYWYALYEIQYSYRILRNITLFTNWFAHTRIPFFAHTQFGQILQSINLPRKLLIYTFFILSHLSFISFLFRLIITLLAILDLLCSTIDHLSQIDYQLIIFPQMIFRYLQCFLIYFHCLFKLYHIHFYPFQMLKLHPQIMISNSQHC